MLTLYHGGLLDGRCRTRLWATTDYEYATAYADTYEVEVWALSVDIRESEILDVTAHGLDAKAVAAALADAGLPGASVGDDEIEMPHRGLWNVPDEAIRSAGFRAIRLCEWTDWGHPVHTGPMIRRTVSLCLVDLSAVPFRAVN